MPIPSTLLAIILAGVDAMATSGGYHFNYGPANVMRPADRVYPQVFVQTREEAAAGVGMAGKNTKAYNVTFRALVAAGAGDAEAEVRKVVSDLERLMEALHPSLNAAGGYLFAEPVSAAWVPRLSRAVPAEVTLVYRLTYRQDRANPESP